MRAVTLGLGGLLCGICGGRYQHYGTGGHLRSRRHRAAEATKGLPAGSADPRPPICGVCGGSAASRERHTRSEMHRDAARRLSLDPRLVDRP